MSVDIYDSVARSSKTLMFKEPYYGLLLLSLNKVANRHIDTAGVSKNGLGTQLSINPDFWADLDADTKVGILKHELLHIAFFHLFMYKDFPDFDLFNIAADLEVNQYIQPEYKGEAWKRYRFYELSTFPELKLPPKAGTRVYYDILKKAEGKNVSPLLDLALSQMRDGQNKLHELWKQFQNMTDIEQKAIETQIKYHLKKAAEGVKKSRGSIPSELEHMINELFVVHKPVVDWKSYTKQFVGTAQTTFTHKTRRRPSKRIPYNPGIKVKHKQHIAVARDTSGSVSDVDIREFDNEIHHLWKAGIKITIIDCDAGISDVWEFKGQIRNTVKGRGGTSFNPVIRYFNDNSRKFDALIYLTDGECNAPDIDPIKKVLWVISSDGTTSYADDYPYSYVQIQR
jgi:predicted metal-dependent peptidase